MPALFIDSDNGLGSPFGDIDDAFAIIALLKSGVSVCALSSTFGNTFESWANRNNQALADLCQYSGPMVRGAGTYWARRSDSSDFLATASSPMRVLALGPLTNVALALRRNRATRITEVIFTGTNFFHTLPVWRFFDFNLWKDPRSAREVFASSVALTIVPCDVARKLRVSEEFLAEWNTPLAHFVKENGRRWFRRARWLKWSQTVPVWDLVAALYVVKPELFETKQTKGSTTSRGRVIYGEEGRPVTVVTGFDPKKLWDLFFQIAG